MSPHIKEDALAAMLEGIISAFHAADNSTARLSGDPFSHCMDCAHAALASLEAGGFSIIWKGAQAYQADWRDRNLRITPGSPG